MSPYWSSLFGGMLLGLACVLLFVFNGRIAGISGIAFSLFERSRLGEWAWKLAFMAGMVGAGVAVLAVLLSMPGLIYELLPVACLIGTLYALATLARHSEITVLRPPGCLRAVSC